MSGSTLINQERKYLWWVCSYLVILRQYTESCQKAAEVEHGLLMPLNPNNGNPALRDMSNRSRVAASRNH